MAIQMKMLIVYELNYSQFSVTVGFFTCEVNHEISTYYSKIIHTVSFDPINQA